MSSGRSSQEVACFSVDFTKYLMFWKSMPVRSEPQLGIGLLAEQPQRLQAQVEHPLRLVLARRDVADDLVVEAALAVAPAVSTVGPAVLVGAELQIFSWVAMGSGSLDCGGWSVEVADAHVGASGDGLLARQGGAQQLLEPLGLIRADLRVLARHVLDRAVALHEGQDGLAPGRAGRGQRAGVAVGRQQLGQAGGPVVRGGVGQVGHRVGVAVPVAVGAGAQELPQHVAAQLQPR